MPDYSEFDAVLFPMTVASAEARLPNEVVPRLVELWLDEYARTTEKREIVETTVERFTYLFDIQAERLIAAWGITGGRAAGRRDASRMAGHPRSPDERYHRGHAIAHALGGGTDINLVPQLASVNIGPFRQLEREALRSSGALYFTYWIYNDPHSQRPAAVEQGLFIAGRLPQIRRHAN
jgi:DNA/RNA non-specific endonuclease